MLCIIIYICLQSCTTKVFHLLPFMADITNSWSQWLLHYMDDYYICPGSVFWCEFNCDVYLVILRISKYVYAFCTIFQCKFNYNVCLVIGPTCFGDFGNLINMYMHSVSFFNANSTVMFVWWLNHLVLVILRLYIHSILFHNVNSTVMSVWWS